MRRIISVIWGLCTLCLTISVQAPIWYVPLGNKVTIPCEGYGHRTTAMWLQRESDNESKIIVHESLGYIFQNKPLFIRKRIVRNFSLEISPFTELDKGIYVCQVCTSSKRCTDGKQITLLPQFDIASKAIRPRYIIEGDQFNYSCLYNVTLKADWRFEALGENIAIAVNQELTGKNVLFIPVVQPNKAGKYSYWEETSTGQQKRICSLSLCVLTVTAGKLTDSPQNCTLYCDVDKDIGESGSADIGTDKWNISITGRMNKSKSFLSCSLLNNSMKTHILSYENATAAVQSYSSYSNHPSVAPVTSDALIGISATLLFILITALVIILYFLQQRAGRNSSRNATGHSEGENESHMIYSSLQFGRYQQQNIITSDTECVYSQIKV